MWRQRLQCARRIVSVPVTKAYSFKGKVDFQPEIVIRALATVPQRGDVLSANVVEVDGVSFAATAASNFDLTNATTSVTCLNMNAMDCSTKITIKAECLVRSIATPTVTLEASTPPPVATATKTVTTSTAIPILSTYNLEYYQVVYTIKWNNVHEHSASRVRRRREDLGNSLLQCV